MRDERESEDRKKNARQTKNVIPVCVEDWLDEKLSLSFHCIVCLRAFLGPSAHIQHNTYLRCDMLPFASIFVRRYMAASVHPPTNTHNTLNGMYEL